MLRTPAKDKSLALHVIPSAEPETVARAYIQAFNQGDLEAMASCFAPGGLILDGMPPHVWQGLSAASDWYGAVLVEGEHAGARDHFVTLGDPSHNAVTGAAAYLVFPATMTFKLNGKPMTQTGAIFTVALRKLAEGWRIAAWAWAKGKPSG